MIEACLFDFDGTLAPLTLDFTGMREEVEKIALSYVPVSLLRGLDNLYTLEMIRAVQDYLGPSGSSFRDEAFARLCELEVEAADGKVLYDYTRDVLGTLRKGGLRIGVVTRNCRAAIKKVFPDIEIYVDAVATREDVTAVKPDPAHILAILRLLGSIDSSKALLVGDHPTDIRAGRATGAMTAGVLAARTNRSAFEEAGATFIIDDIRDVPALVDGM